jgi:chromosome partitioning protein
MEIIAIANQKGGVGKTTTAVNLSAALAEAGAEVLLADFDPQANATSAIGLSEINGISAYHALLGQAPISDAIIPTRFDHLFCIPAEIDLAGAEIEIARMDNHLYRLRDALSDLRQNAPFDFVIVDCPPSVGILMTNAMVAADELLIPIQCEYLALEGLSKIVHLISQIRDGGANPMLSVGGILMTMFDGRTNLSAQVLAEVKNHFGEQVFRSVIPRSVRLGEAPSFGQTILEYDPAGPGATAYRALAVEVMERHPFSRG